MARELAAARAELAALRRELAAAQSAALTAKTDLDILSRRYSNLMAAKLEVEEQRDRCAGGVVWAVAWAGARNWRKHGVFDC